MNSYPFDPMGMDSPDKRVKEVKNGRLAMVRPLPLCTFLLCFLS